MGRSKRCKHCGGEVLLTWGRYCGTCRRTLGLSLRPDVPGRGKRRGDFPKSTDALAHRLPGSFESGKRR